MQTYKYFEQTIEDKNIYIGEYFSGPDVSIKIINNATEEEVEIESINFDVQEQLLPIYGYNSSTCDEIAIGQRIVIGEFVVNIKNEVKNINLNLEYAPKIYEPYLVFVKRPGWANNNDENLNNNNNHKPNCSCHNKGDTNETNKEDNNITDNVLKFSEQVKEIQKILYEKGYDVIINGFMDIKTKDAITKYQTENEITISGQIDDELIESLFETEIYNGIVINDTTLYYSPYEDANELVTLGKGCKVKIITSFDGYYYVSISNYIGYVKQINIELIE